ncbi:MAG: hypothetical protein AAF639_13785 [Chloroflexota bacterium]
MSNNIRLINLLAAGNVAGLLLAGFLAFDGVGYTKALAENVQAAALAAPAYTVSQPAPATTMQTLNNQAIGSQTLSMNNGWVEAQPQQAGIMPVSNLASMPMQATGIADNSSIGQLQAQNNELMQMLTLMQQREQEYQTQIMAANLAMQDMQTQASGGYDEEEAYEEEEHEEEEHGEEYGEEHEEEEHGEYGEGGMHGGYSE